MTKEQLRDSFAEFGNALIKHKFGEPMPKLKLPEVLRDKSNKPTHYITIPK